LGFAELKHELDGEQSKPETAPRMAGTRVRFAKGKMRKIGRRSDGAKCPAALAMNKYAHN
jgi:hypothetical protein